MNARIARHDRVSAALAELDHRQLTALLDSASPLGAGIGGTTWRLTAEGGPVFVKRVALTDVERRHEGSTADLYGLPPWSHYGVGSAGGGAWRELAAHRLASDWVHKGQCGNFLLLHHWRVLPGLPRGPLDRAALERDVAFWHGDPGVRRRLEALAASTADLVLFLEYLPHTVTRYPDLGDRAVEADLLAVTDFLASQEIQHFDAHFANIVTDGDRLYLTDFGLAVAARFELADAEAEFLATHATHDRAYVLTQLVNRIAARLRRWPHPSVRNDFVRDCAAGRAVPELSPEEGALLRKYAPLATVVNEFYFALHGESRKTPYPREEITRQLDRLGLRPAG
ncbi:hypothetical protein ABJI51_11800 [Amycolatopsis sp. NEAU-NG30]|uniref:Protein kinase domain-containing protein n=1 Tax=Amycolatopsis melonis TaxID=3156488 RepID=A0ABV0LBV0_9PSEU